MTTIAVRQDLSEYALTEDLDLVCTHAEAVIEPPCCNGRDCGCYGQYSVYCPNIDCTGITDNEVDELIGNFIDGQERDYDEYY